MPIVTKLNLLKERRTKIIATLGPSSMDRDKIKLLIEAGADVVRLNMSHGDHQTHRDVYHRVREISANLNKHVAILVDLLWTQNPYRSF